MIEKFLQEQIELKIQVSTAHEKVRYEILNRFGYFVTESSEHFAEYVPWFIKSGRNDLIDKYKIPIDEYIDRCKFYESLWEKIEQDTSQITEQEIKRSNEYAIIYNGWIYKQ